MFTETERQIFRYSDGTADRFADPMAVWRKLGEAADERDTSLETLMEHVRHEHPKVFLPAIATLAAIVRAAFDLAPFDTATGRGLTEAECLDTLYHFMRFQDDSKKKPETSAPSSERTASLPA